MSQFTEQEQTLAETLRTLRLAEIASESGDREALEKRYGKVWSTAELTTDFEVQGFMAPFVVVTRRSDNKVGSLEFQHRPRFYFNWKEDER